MGFDEMVAKYSEPLPCDTCENVLPPIGGFSRAKNCLCKKYSAPDNMKPHGVLFCNEQCQFHTMKSNDGGPGSGNFGHKGRPGLVGGSGPGGGKQYRGGRSDIGYYGSRKDWLNGLQGEEQHSASKFLNEMKKHLQTSLEIKDKIKKLNERGLLTKEEAENSINEKGLGYLDENTPVEQYILRNEKAINRDDLINYVQNARNWKENSEKLIAENLTPEEKKLYDFLDSYGNALSLEGGTRVKRDLMFKAMDIPGSGEPVPDEILYAAGIKERPKVKIKINGETGPDYEWYKEKRQHLYSNMEPDMSEALGSPRYGHKYTPEEFAQLNKDFVNAMKYERLSPVKCKCAVRAISGMRALMSGRLNEQHNYWETDPDGFKVPAEMISRLTDEEKDRLVDIGNRMTAGFAPVDKFEKVEDIDPSNYGYIEHELRELSLRTSAEQQLVRDYVTIMDKMLTGETASENNTVQARKQAEKEAAEQRHKEFVEKRDREQKAFMDSGEHLKKRATVKYLKEKLDDRTIESLDNGGIERAIRQSGVMHDGRPFVTSQLVPTPFYQASLKAYVDVVSKFPFLAGELGGFGDNYTGGIAGCNKNAYSQSGTEILVNVQAIKDLGRWAMARKNGEADGFYAKTSDDIPVGYADVTHELGHALSNWLHRYCFGAFAPSHTSDRGFFTNRYYDNEVANILKERTFKALGIRPTYENIKQEVSAYAAASRTNKGADQTKATTRSDEFFAECFSELMSSKSPRRVAAEFGRQLEKFIKENGITGDSTATTASTLPNLLK